MSRQIKSRDQLGIELKEQIEAFRASADNYDRGSGWEFKRLANSVAILLYDGKPPTRSLLGLLGMKDAVQMVSSLPVKDKEDTICGLPVVARSSTPLLVMKFGAGGISYEPKYVVPEPSEDLRLISFDAWWSEPVLEQWSGFNLTRKDLVLTIRNQDGGAHVDDGIKNISYSDFLRHGDPFVRVVDGGMAMGPNIDLVGEPILNGLRATMRQVAWEVDETLKRIGY